MRVAEVDATGRRLVVTSFPGARRRVVELPVAVASDGLVWTPDGQSLAALGQDRQRAYLIDPAAATTEELAIPRSRWLSGLAWSRDGRRLAFAADPDGNCDRDQIAPRIGVLDRHTEEVAWLTTQRRLKNAFSELAGKIVWSPTGDLVAFVRTGYGDECRDAFSSDEIWVAATDGSGSRELPFSRIGPDATLKWSPAGTEVAASGAEGGITIVNEATGAARTVHTDGLLIAWGPRGIYGWCGGPVCVVDPTGASDVRELAVHAGDGWLSRDGRWLVVESREGFRFVDVSTEATRGHAAFRGGDEVAVHVG